MLKAAMESDHISFCPLPYTKMIACASGTVISCCHQMKPIGNIHECENLLELWKNNNIVKEMQERTSAGKLHEHCKLAPNCPFHIKPKKPFRFNKKGIKSYTKFFYPTHLEIDLPDSHCNVGGENPTKDTACIMCIRSHAFKKQKDITNLIVEKSKPLFPHLRKFSILGVAEPFWKDATFKIFEQVDFKKYRDQITFDTNHNVTCFGERTQEKFLEWVKFSELQFSIDAATPSTYKKIRILDAYDLVIKNLKLWIKKKNKNHKVIIWNNINLINVREMTAMVEVAADAGVDGIMMLPTQSQSGHVDLGELMINEKNLHIFKKESDLAQDRAIKLGVSLYYIVPFDVAPKNKTIDDCRVNSNKNEDPLKVVTLTMPTSTKIKI